MASLVYKDHFIIALAEQITVADCGVLKSISVGKMTADSTINFSPVSRSKTKRRLNASAWRWGKLGLIGACSDEIHPPRLVGAYMARPLRIEFDGALYHVTSRGNEREAIFKDDTDRGLFLR